MLSFLFLVNKFYEYFYVIAISSYKFLFAGSAAVASGFNYWETSLSLSLGGLIGFFIFYFFSVEIIKIYNSFSPPKPKIPKAGWMKKYRRKLSFRKYGVPVLLITGPSLFSIPLTAFIVRRWFREIKHVIVYFCISIICWAFVFGTMVQFNLV
jgi:hypothetical protein